MPTSTSTVRLATVAVAAVLVGGLATVTAVASAPPSADSSRSVTAGEVTTGGTLAGDLAFSREEERMARDLYRLFSRQHGADRPFGMIALSEQRHFDAVGALLERYGVADPSAGLPAGTYADPTLQRLYDRLRTAGLRSLQGAYQVGVTVEKRDIADLTATLDNLEQDDVRAVLTQLRQGSQHHLAAFQGAASGAGGMAGRMGGGMGGGMDGTARWGLGAGAGRMDPPSGMGRNRWGSPSGSGQGPRDQQGWQSHWQSHWQSQQGRGAAGGRGTRDCAMHPTLP